MFGRPSFKNLADITNKSCYVDVFAVVKYFTEPKSTRGTDNSLFLTLVDPTLYQHEASIKCICFEKDDKDFPLINNVGDVVRFTSLKVSEFNNKIQVTGRMKKGFSWVTFDGRRNVPVTPRCSPNYPRPKLNDEDTKKVEELKSWASTIPMLSRLSLEKLTPGNFYFDLLCQIVSIEILDATNGSCILHVWDGTVPGIASLMSSNQSFTRSTKWGDKVLGKCARIYAFSNLSALGITVKTRDYVLITNLHLTSKNELIVNEASTKIVHFLALYEEGETGQGINVINEKDPYVKWLIGHMNQLPASAVLTNDTNTISSSAHLPQMTGSGQSLFKSLGEITNNDYFVNVFAVVKYFTEPKSTRGTDNSLFLTLVDPTLYQHEASIKCICFEKDDKDFPLINNVGDVVRFTSLKVSEFNNRFQVTGRTKNGFSWVTFDGRPNAPVVPRFSPNSPSPTLSDEDMKKVEELKSWALTIPMLFPDTKRLSLEKLTPGNLYFDLLCQIVFIEILDATNGSCILHVWDGTIPGIASLMSSNQSCQNLSMWGDKVLGKCARIYAFFNMSDVGVPVKPWDYVLITNLHLKPKGREIEDNSLIVHFLTLYEEGETGQGINVVNEKDPDVKRLIGRMNQLQAPSVLTNDTNKISCSPHRPQITGSGSRFFKSLGEITNNDYFLNVFAVVKYFTEPKSTRGTDKSLFLTLVDPTVCQREESIKCICFEKDDEDFPLINNVGDVVRFTSLTVSEFNNQFQVTGRTKNGFSWVTFDGRPNVPVVPRFSPNSPSPTLSDEDMKKVEELKSWALTIPMLSPDTKRLSLEKLTPGNLYFDLLCQIVSVEILDATNGSCVLHVWDGTIPGIASLMSCNKSCESSSMWGDKVLGKCAKIYAFFNLSDVGIPVKSWDYVLITNLHLKPKGREIEDNSSAEAVHVLVLHEGRDFGRGITVISEGDSDVRQLSSRMEALKNVSNDPNMQGCGDSGLPRTMTGVYKYPRETFFALKLPTSNVSNSEYVTPQVTAIKGLKASPNMPGLFLVKARVYAYWPKKAIEFVRYVCHHCKKIYLPGDVADVFNSEAPQVCLDGNCGRALSLCLFFSLILRDREQFIDVVVFDGDAKTFFPDVDPGVLYNDKAAQEWLEKRLSCLLHEKIWVEYVIASSYAGLTANDGQPLPVYRVTETRFPQQLEEFLTRAEPVNDSSMN